MNYGLILAGGVGQRMLNSGMPKQFLEIFGKPIIIYTIEKFESCDEIGEIVIACNVSWIDYLNDLVKKYGLKKVRAVISGGKDRQESIVKGLTYIQNLGADGEDVVVIHDGVRPLVQERIISENVRMAARYGSAITVRPVLESVVITENESVGFTGFKNRDETYSLTAPQSFKLKAITEAYDKIKEMEPPMPLLDAAQVYTFLGNEVQIIKESNQNIKITTPEDYYILKAMLELQENKRVFGL